MADDGPIGAILPPYKCAADPSSYIAIGGLGGTCSRAGCCLLCLKAVPGWVVGWARVRLQVCRVQARASGCRRLPSRWLGVCPRAHLHARAVHRVQSAMAICFAVSVEPTAACTRPCSGQMAVAAILPFRVIGRRVGTSIFIGPRCGPKLPPRFKSGPCLSGQHPAEIGA